jgi:AraC-like DNA-binding protein
MGSSVAVPLERHLLRARDLIDRAYADPLDVPALAGRAKVSRAHFSRSFKRTFGETPHRYLMSVRMEHARRRLSVTDVCTAVGFASLGSFSTQFRRFVGESPSAYRDRAHHPGLDRIPGCFVRMRSRPTPR